MDDDDNTVPGGVSVFESCSTLAAAERTIAVTRGVRRLLAGLGLASVAEVALANGRRADVLAIDAAGSVIIVEVKVSVADLRGDRKWPDYEPYCDRLFFAVPPGFPDHLVPSRPGLIVADAYEGAVLRDAPTLPLPAARRKAMLLRFALAAAQRLYRLEDPMA
ncbi:MAG: MmcB family DNA repair protein [Rhodospirillaceae bacterium]|nr:MmcB family DNA repair protein [Rhodospirillaceae bacterium]